MTDDEDDGSTNIIICQGPPLCLHVADDGYDMDQCQLCDILNVSPYREDYYIRKLERN